MGTGATAGFGRRKAVLALLLSGGYPGGPPLGTLFGYFLWCKRKYLARRCENRQNPEALPAPAGKKASYQGHSL